MGELELASMSTLDTSVAIIEDEFMVEIAEDGFNPLQWWLESMRNRVSVHYSLALPVHKT